MPTWFYFGIDGMEYRYNPNTGEVLTVTPAGIQTMIPDRAQTIGVLFRFMCEALIGERELFRNENGRL